MSDTNERLETPAIHAGHIPDETGPRGLAADGSGEKFTLFNASGPSPRGIRHAHALGDLRPAAGIEAFDQALAATAK